MGGGSGGAAHFGGGGGAGRGTIHTANDVRISFSTITGNAGNGGLGGAGSNGVNTGATGAGASGVLASAGVEVIMDNIACAGNAALSPTGRVVAGAFVSQGYNFIGMDKGQSFSSAIDQRGVKRIYDNPALANAPGGDGADIGAMEAQPAYSGPPMFIHVRNIGGTFVELLLQGTAGGQYQLQRGADLESQFLG